MGDFGVHVSFRPGFNYVICALIRTAMLSMKIVKTLSPIDSTRSRSWSGCLLVEQVGSA